MVKLCITNDFFVKFLSKINKHQLCPTSEWNYWEKHHHGESFNIYGMVMELGLGLGADEKTKIGVKCHQRICTYDSV